jgi:hypothetical protein
MTDSPPSRFRLPHWGWFLLATVVLVVAGIGLSIWLPYHREQQLIKEINSWGVGQYVTITRGPEWLRKLIGNDRMDEIRVFSRVNGVIFEGSKFNDAEFAYLIRWPNLERFSLVGTGVTDAGMVHMSGLTNVKSFNIAGTMVTDKGLAHLSGCTKLESLNLFNLTAVTDASLPHLSRLRNLVYLNIGHTAVTDAGVQELQKALPDCDIHH